MLFIAALVSWLLGRRRKRLLERLLEQTPVEMYRAACPTCPAVYDHPDEVRAAQALAVHEARHRRPNWYTGEYTDTAVEGL